MDAIVNAAKKVKMEVVINVLKITANALVVALLIYVPVAQNVTKMAVNVVVMEILPNALAV